MIVYVLTYYDPFERYAFTNFNKALKHFYEVNFEQNNLEQVIKDDEEMRMMCDFIHAQTGKTIAEYVFSIQTPEEFNEIFEGGADIVALDVL